MLWSSPVRKSGTVYLSPIPNEIYLEIFSYLRPSDPNEWINAEARQHFCNLALVCRFFSSVMLPWIFENITFVEKDSYSQISSPLSSSVSAKFCRNVLDGDTTALLLAKHIKRWAFSGSLTQSKSTPAFLSMYFETFQHLPNLLELSLSNIVIPKEFFKCLANVPTLEALTIENSLFDEDVRRKHLKHFDSLRLKRLALAHVETHSQLSLLLPHLNMSSLIRLELDIPRLQEFPLSHPSLPLEYLYLADIRNSVRIVELLESTPYLKVLRVAWFSDVTHNFVLKPQVIPQLSELGGCWPLCVQIMPGRPISRLELIPTSGGIGRDEMKVLAGSKSLIALKSILFTPPLGQFPDLENLEILMSLFDRDWVESTNSVFKAWSHHPNLRSLRLVFCHSISGEEIDSKECQILELLDVTFPVVTSVQFSFPPLDSVALSLNSYKVYDTWSYTRVVGGSWHRTFRLTRHPRRYFL